MSIEKSGMSPKRVSKPFTVTRRDCQIKAGSHLFPEGGVGFRPIPCGNGRYRLELENSADNICTVDDLAEEIQRASGLSINVVNTVLGTLLEVVPAFIARKNGCAVRLGNLVTLKPCITGALDAANGRLDPKKHRLEIHATESPALRHALAQAPLMNLERNANELSRIFGGPSAQPERDRIDAENEILVNGSDIYVPCQPADADSGKGRVWVETRAGRRLGGCAVLTNGPNLLTVRFVPDAPLHEADRECRVVVETCGTQAKAEAEGPKRLSRLTRDVTFIGPVTAAS